MARKVLQSHRRTWGLLAVATAFGLAGLTFCAGGCSTEMVNVPAIQSAQEFDTAVASGPTIVMFSMKFCPHCAGFAPKFDELAGEFGDKVTFLKVDKDDFREVNDRFGIRGWPTIILFRNGVESNRWVGDQSAKNFRADLRSAAAGR